MSRDVAWDERIHVVWLEVVDLEVIQLLSVHTERADAERFIATLGSAMFYRRAPGFSPWCWCEPGQNYPPDSYRVAHGRLRIARLPWNPPTHVRWEIGGQFAGYAPTLVEPGAPDSSDVAIVESPEGESE